MAVSGFFLYFMVMGVSHYFNYPHVHYLTIFRRE